MRRPAVSPGERFFASARTLPDGTWVVEARGDLDLFTVPGFKAALGDALAERPACLEIDLCEVTALDSSGLAAVVGAHRRLAPSGGELVIVVGDDDTEKKFRLTGLDQVLSIRRR